MNDFDVIIVGSGVAGLFCALQLNPDLSVLIITKSNVRECNSYLAQGGITTVLDEEDKASFIQDTLQAGKQENDINALTMVADNADEIISELVSLKMPFTMENGQLQYTREGAHSKNRIVYAKDETGKHLMETLITHIDKRANITLWEDTTLVDILESRGGETKGCAGVLVEKDGKLIQMTCRTTVLACGGIGGLFKKTTNQNTVVGDAIAIAHKHGIELKHINYIQFHPTSLYEPSIDTQRCFLISESVRGEGAYLLNHDKQRFIDELLPRDVVTVAILKEQIKEKSAPYVYLDISHKNSYDLKERFPYIYKTCLEAGYDITTGPVPVTPAQHYHMGGIRIDLNGKTSLNNLYAIGEVGCSGIHGANRLASNSLLEALVYAKKAAMDMNASAEETVPKETVLKDRTNLILYEELIDANFRAQTVRDLLTNKNGGIQDELYRYR